MYFLETLQVRVPCHGGVLYSLILMECCFMNFLNIEKNKIIFFFNISCFLRVSCYFQPKKNIGVKKNSGGGGVLNFF